jgi:hypothetical protein
VWRRLNQGIAQSFDRGVQVLDAGLRREPQGMLDIGLPSRFGGGELDGGELGAQIIGLALERAPIGNLPFEHCLQRRQNRLQKRSKGLRVQGTRGKAVAPFEGRSAGPHQLGIGK